MNIESITTDPPNPVSSRSNESAREPHDVLSRIATALDALYDGEYALAAAILEDLGDELYRALGPSSTRAVAA